MKQETWIRRIHRGMVSALVVLLGAVLVSPAFAAKKSKAKTSDGVRSYPAGVQELIQGAGRFQDPDYFAIAASDGILQVAPEAIFDRLAKAAEGGENYKAMYLARILTRVAPNTAETWSNRARLAASLGLTREAVACEKNALAPNVPEPVSPSMLPGAFQPIRPKTLSDWAAALGLIADDLAAAGHSLDFVAVKDAVSGISVSTDAESPSCSGKPVALDHVIPNLFAMTGASPMKANNIGWGNAILAGLAGVGQVAAAQVGDMQAQSNFSKLMGESTAGAVMTEAAIQGGKYTMVTYPKGRRTEKKSKPEICGEYAAKDMPVPLLWISGGSMASAMPGRVAQGGKEFMSVRGPKDKETRRVRRKSPKSLQIVKLASLRVDDEVQPTVSLLELILNEHDVRRFDPAGRGSELADRLPNLSKAAAAYVGNPTRLNLGTLSQNTIVGFDAKKIVYGFRLYERAWLVAQK